MPKLPAARGPASEWLLAVLSGSACARAGGAPVPAVADVLADDDVQLALYICYELHYRGLPGVDDRWEWDVTLLTARAAWEELFEVALLGALGAPDGARVAAEDMDVALRAVVDADDSPSLSQHLDRDGTLEEVLEFVVHRSAYQLKEADPHSWATRGARSTSRQIRCSTATSSAGCSPPGRCRSRPRPCGRVPPPPFTFA